MPVHWVVAKRSKQVGQKVHKAAVVVTENDF
jgi:hypothetical protein